MAETKLPSVVATPTSPSATSTTWIDAKSPVEDMDHVTQSEIAGMWEEAKAQFERITGKKLGDGAVPFEKVSAIIESRQKQEFDSLEEKDNDGWEKARSIGDKLATCAKLLIGLAQQIAPYTVPGAGLAVDLCGNALVMLIDVPGKIREFNASIDETFSKVSTALDQIKMITGRVDKISKHLAKHLHNLMVGFIKVCAHAINLQYATKRAKLKAHFKNIMAGDDSDLAAAVADFEQIAQNFAKIEQTEIYVLGNKTHALAVGVRADVSRVAESTSKASERVKKLQDQMEESSKKKKETSEREIRLQRILKAFTLEDKVKIEDNNARKNKAIVQYLDGTLQWLFDDGGTYKAWREKEESPMEILIVTGGVGSGKSTVVGKIVEDLEAVIGRSQRTSVAYYFFPPLDKKADEDPTPVLTALKQMAVQLCQQDDTVARTLSDALQTGSGADDDNKEIPTGIKGKIKRLLSKELKLDSPNTGATYFLVFDGIECLLQRNEEAGKALLELVFDMQPPAALRSAVKVIVSGTNETFAAYLDKEGRSSRAAVIDMDKTNYDDMRLCIDHQLSERKMFLNAAQGSLGQKARDMLRKDLPGLVKGQYSMLIASLGRIESLIKDKRAQLKDLRNILDELQPSNIHVDTIASLRQKLDPDDIKELNEVLKWVLHGARTFTVEELEAALLFYSQEQPLVSLEYRLMDMYNGVFNIDEHTNEVTVKDGLADVLRRSIRATKETAEGDARKITATITITNASFEETQSFLWDLAIRGIRENFSFFQQGDGTSRRNLLKPEIGVHVLDAHLSFIQYAFKYIEEERQEHKERMGQYLLQFLPFHLAQCLPEPDPADSDDGDDDVSDVVAKKAPAKESTPVTGETDIEKPSITRAPTMRALDKRQTSDGTVAAKAEAPAVLTDAEKREVIRGLRDVFDNDYPLERHPQLFRNFVWSLSDFESIDRWINEDMVRQYNRSWLRTVVSKSRPLPGYLRVWTEKLCEHWLRADDWPEWDVWRWIQQLYMKDASAEKDSGRPSYAKAQEVADWCQKIVFNLGDENLDSIWYERLGETVSLNWGIEAEEEALALLKKAVQLPNSAWTASDALCQLYRRMDEMDLAIEQARIAVEKCPADKRVNARFNLCYLLETREEGVEEARSIYESLLPDPSAAFSAWFNLLWLFTVSRHAKQSEMSKHTKLLFESAGRLAENDTILVAVVRYTSDSGNSVYVFSQVLDRVRDNQTNLQAFFAALEKVSKTETVGSERDGYPPTENSTQQERETAHMGMRNGAGYFRGAVAHLYPELVTEGLLSQTGIQIWEGVMARGFDEWGMGFDRSATALAFYYADQLAKSTTIADQDKWIKSLQILDEKWDKAKKKADSGRMSDNSIPLANRLQASFFANRSRKEEARAVLRENVKTALNILMDHDESNDAVGYVLIAVASFCVGDFADAMSAFTWLGEADHVKFQTPEYPEVPDATAKAWKKAAYIREVERIRNEVLPKVYERVPDKTKQRDRLLEAAKICLEIANEVCPLTQKQGEDGTVPTVEASGTGDKTANVEGVSPVQNAGTPEESRDAASTSKTTDKSESGIQVESGDAAPTDKTVAKPDQGKPTSEMVKRYPYVTLSERYTWVANELGRDGKGYISGWALQCNQGWNEYCEDRWWFTHDTYVCLVCNERTFCQPHFAELRDEARHPEIETFHICQRKSHRWLRVPAWGHAMFEAPRRKGERKKAAMRVWAGGEVPTKEGDDRVFDGGSWTGYEEVDGDVWLGRLREKWGIKSDELEEAEQGSDREDEPDEDEKVDTCDKEKTEEEGGSQAAKKDGEPAAEV